VNHEAKKGLGALKVLLRIALISACIPVAQTAQALPSHSISHTVKSEMRVSAVAAGDCALNRNTILVSDATTSCSIDISITPPKRYKPPSWEKCKPKKTCLKYTNPKRRWGLHFYINDEFSFGYPYLNLVDSAGYTSCFDPSTRKRRRWYSMPLFVGTKGPIGVLITGHNKWSEIEDRYIIDQPSTHLGTEKLQIGVTDSEDGCGPYYYSALSNPISISYERCSSNIFYFLASFESLSPDERTARFDTFQQKCSAKP